MPYVYILHFHTPLAHAQHYTGCTCSVRARLTAHANGAGSRLTRELIKQGIGWELGSLLQCSRKRMRELERHLKDQKNASRFCGTCSNPPARMAGTTHYPVEEIQFPTTSDGLRSWATPETVRTIRLTAEGEPKETMSGIVEVWKEDRDGLGFIPIGGEGGLNGLISRGQIAVAFEGEEVVGYAAYSVNPSRTRVTVNQCCVGDKARLQGVGRRLIQLVEESTDAAEIVAKVRIDLAANHFWAAIGFQTVETVTHRTSGSRITTYRKMTGKEQA